MTSMSFALVPLPSEQPASVRGSVGSVTRFLTLLLGGALVTACANEPSGFQRIQVEPARPKVLLIGIDGVRPDVMAEVPTPNLDTLARVGLFIDDAQTTTPSVSGPAWSSMLTGVWPAKHGVTNNEFTAKRYDEFPDFLTRIEQVRPDLSTAAIADWMPLVRAEEGIATISDAVDVKHALDGYELGWAEADGRAVALAIELLTGADPDALFVYLGNPDETSHEHESIGEEYRAAIALADQHVGEIVAAVRARASFASEDWLILCSTDHGRRPDGGHGADSPEEMTIFVISSGAESATAPIPRDAVVVDVAATALTHLGVAIQPEWELDGRSLLGH